jgi:hypothetical protein
MDTTNSNDKSKPRRRHGRLVEEIAKENKFSVYRVKQAFKLMKEAPELVDYVIVGQLSHKQCFGLIKHGLVPYVVDGKLPCTECDRVIRELRQLVEPELTFEETVEASFRKWLSKWAKEDRREVREIVDEMLYGGAIVELIPSQEAENLGVESDPETRQTKTKKGKAT